MGRLLLQKSRYKPELPRGWRPLDGQRLHEIPNPGLPLLSPQIVKHVQVLVKSDLSKQGSHRIPNLQRKGAIHLKRNQKTIRQENHHEPAELRPLMVRFCN